jgi:hypothetical protein
MQRYTQDYTSSSSRWGIPRSRQVLGTRRSCSIMHDHIGKRGGRGPNPGVPNTPSESLHVRFFDLDGGVCLP